VEWVGMDGEPDAAPAAEEAPAAADGEDAPRRRRRTV